MTATALPLPRHAPVPRTRPPLRVVAPASRRVRRRRRTLVYGWATAGTLLTVVAFHAFLAQNQIGIDRLEQRTNAAERRYEEARYRNAQLSAPKRITARAQQLGLVPPDRPPTVVPVAGEVPSAPDAPSGTLDGWTDVKPTLGAGP